MSHLSLLSALLLVSCASEDAAYPPDCEPGEYRLPNSYCDERGYWQQAAVSCPPGIIVSDQGVGFECTCSKPEGAAPDEFECESRALDAGTVQLLLDRLD